MDPISPPSLILFFLLTTGLTVAALLAIVRSAAPRRLFAAALGLTLWMALTYALASNGLLRFDTMPPTAMVVIGTSIVLSTWVGLSAFGSQIARNAPLWFLVGFQSFRLLVEIFLDWAYRAGIVPVQMTFEGRNWDILAGITAIPVAWLIVRGKLGERGIFLWNCFGLALLLNIVTIAILSAPLPFRVFMNDPPNVFVTRAPYIWLPAVLVQAAWLGHLLVFRKLHQASQLLP